MEELIPSKRASISEVEAVEEVCVCLLFERQYPLSRVDAHFATHMSTAFEYFSAADSLFVLCSCFFLFYDYFLPLIPLFHFSQNRFCRRGRTRSIRVVDNIDCHDWQGGCNAGVWFEPVWRGFLLLWCNSNQHQDEGEGNFPVE